MGMDQGVIVTKLLDRAPSATEIPFSEVRGILKTVTPSDDLKPTDEPDLYRWFLIQRFPTKTFWLTLKRIMDAAGDEAPDEKRRHDRIVRLLKSGKPEWPVFVTTDGIVFDGWHRIAAHRTLNHDMIDVVVAVRKQNANPSEIDRLWNSFVPR